MINDIILILFMFAGILGSLIIVSTNNHINLCLGYLSAIFGISGVLFTLNSNSISIILLLLHTITVILIISFGIFACGFKIKIETRKDTFVSLISFLSGSLLFIVLIITLLKNNFQIIHSISYSQSLGSLLTQKYVVLFELIAISIFIAITGSVFILRRRV
jgi:NADH:ubiquinone oxidoreductase subunit 6 (subunit J)